MECRFEIPQQVDGDGEAWSWGVGLGTFNSFDHILEQGVCSGIAIAVLNVVETEVGWRPICWHNFIIIGAAQN